MDIDKILSDLGLDFTDPETKRGALEAIDAIISSRAPQPDLGDLGGGGETDIELDPDLVQPSVKHKPTASDDDIEIEDEEDILSQMKHNDSEQDFDDADQNDGAGNGSTSSSSDSSGSNESDPNTSSGSNNSNTSDDDGDDISSENDSNDGNTSSKKPIDDEEDDDDYNNESDRADSDDEDDDYTDLDDSDDDDHSSDNDDDTDGDFDYDSDDSGDEDQEDEDDTDGDDLDTAEDADSDSDGDDYEEIENEEENEEEEIDENEEDEDYIEDDLEHIFDDKQITSKHEARKVKRERTVAAGKKALEDAKARNTSPALIRELENAIAALEALTEAVKNIKDISDDEFNLLVNRVFDAIDAVGDKSLTFTTDEERETKVKEIKADLDNETTRADLSAEDAARIRAEHQAQRAREKETAKYQTKARNSFKGFQEFLNSLYRAVALQVNTEETNDSSWSALSRRNSGVGVLQQGKRIQELPNKKIPVIDFYFDQSGSWDDADIKVGEKAVAALADMEADGKIKINIYYFSNDVYTDAASARADGGTAGWNEIVKNVIATNATNVIIMTDADMEDWWKGDTALHYTVPGYVWYLWRDGINAPRLPRDLKGRGGTQQFSFNANDA